MRVDLLFHTGSTCDASDGLIASAGVMALVPLIGIGLMLPTNLHEMDGLPLRWGGGVYCFLVHTFGRSVPFFSPSISQLIVGFSSVGSFA